jgi:chromosomal replication initiator protein
MKYKKEMEEIMSLINNAHDMLNKVITGLGRKESELSVYTIGFDPKKNFQNFIEGDSNKLAYRVGLSIAANTAPNIYNPFFIYGPSGSGKSHLINAIGLKFQETNPNKRVLCVSALQFQRQFADSVRHNTTNDFIKLYQSVELLIVDDIQEWMDAPKTLETFIQIFNQMICTGKQIILASNCRPVDLNGIKCSVLERFASGLAIELEKPNEQLCIDILNAKCNHVNQKISREVIEFIAKTANSSVFELAGVMNSLMAHSAISNSVIDIPMAKCIIMRYKKTE